VLAAAELARVEDERDVRRQALALAGLGAPAIPVLFEALYSGRMELVLDGDETRLLTLSPDQEECLLVAFEHLPGDPVRDHLLEEVVLTDTARGVALLRVLERIGASRDIIPLLERLTAHEETCALFGTLGETLETTLSAVIERDSTAAHRLLAEIPLTSRSLWTYLVSALACSDDPAATGALARLLNVDDELDSIVLCTMGSEGPDRPIEVQIRWAAACRWHLESIHEVNLREAAFALGRLLDTESVPALLELLEHDDPAVRRAAEHALGEISGLHMEADPATWRSLVREEQTWWLEDYPEVREVLERGAPRTAQALSDISQIRFRRHDVARDLAALVEAGAPNPALLCETLGMLGSPHAIPALQAVLLDPDPQVQSAARRALAALAPSENER